MGKPIKYVPITELLKDIVDNRGKSVPTSPTGTPLIATNCIKHSSIYPTFEKVRYVDAETLKTWFRAHLQPNDILFVNKGTPGRVCLVPNPVNFCAAQDMIGFRCDETKINYKYLFAVLRSSEIQKTIENNHVGLVIPHFRKQDLPSLMIPIRSPEEQEVIGNLYITLSEKIELNQRINAELEAMAKTLYDYWFVQFEYPTTDPHRPYRGTSPKSDIKSLNNSQLSNVGFWGGREGVGYKSAGGKMVWNEELKREIPLGWEVGTLGDILSLEYGKPLKEEDRSGSGYPVLGSNGIVGYHKEYLIEGYGIVVGRKGTAGAVVWVEDNFYPIDTAFYVKDKLGINELFFHYLLLLRSSIKQGESSSAVPGLNRNFAHSIKVPIPEISIIQNFNKIVEPFFAKIKSCNKESQTLTELRDWLLPMLMNGQVKIK